MFTALLVKKQKVIHATDLRCSADLVREDLDNLPQRFKSKKEYYQIVQISLLGDKNSKKYGILFV